MVWLWFGDCADDCSKRTDDSFSKKKVAIMPDETEETGFWVSGKGNMRFVIHTIGVTHCIRNCVRGRSTRAKRDN